MMIREAIIVTQQPDGRAHVTPMGYRRDGDVFDVAPFHPSQTLDNLRRHGRATLNVSDDVCVIAGCLTGRREWPVLRASHIDGWRLAEVLTHWELAVVAIDDDHERPRFRLRVEHEQVHAGYRGHNRAQAAVIEAAILVSRLDWLPPEQVASELAYLRIAVDKTAGERERLAWSWLLSAVAAHPRHGAGQAASIGPL